MTTGITSTQIPFAKAYDDEPEYLYSTMVFQQSYAPVGWIRKSSANDVLLRVVSGNSGISSGGVNGVSVSNFSKPLSVSSSYSFITSTYTTPANDMPVHTHTFTAQSGVVTGYIGSPSPAGSPFKFPFILGSPLTPTTVTLGTTPTTTGHSHTLTVPYTFSSPSITGSFQFKYVDAIPATRYFRGFDE